MADDKAEEKTGEKQKKEKSKEEQKAKSKSALLKWIIIAASSVIVLGAGGFLGWNFVLKKNNTSVEKIQPVAESHSEETKAKNKILCQLESFIVNLSDKAGSGNRYLKVTIELEVDDEAGKNIIESHKTEMKDTILLLLSSLSFEDINSIEGKLDLKQSLLSRINQVLGSSIILKIYFTEFVVQ